MASNNNGTPSGRVLRSHVKQMKQEQEKEAKTTVVPDEKEKKRKKVSGKSTPILITPDEEEASESKAPPAVKPGRKRKRTASSEDEHDQENEQAQPSSDATNNTVKYVKPLGKQKALKESDKWARNNANATTSSDSNSTLKLTANILEPIYNLRATLTSVLAKLPKPAPVQANLPSPPPLSAQSVVQPTGVVWGSLISQYQHHPNISLTGSSFSIGRNSRCDYTLRDTSVSAMLCKFHYANGMVLVEGCSGSGNLTLNGRSVKKNVRLMLRSGDEVAFMGNKPYSFIFQQLYNSQPTTNTNPLIATAAVATNNSSNNNNLIPLNDADKLLFPAPQTGAMYTEIMPPAVPVAYMTRSRTKQTPDIDSNTTTTTTTTTTSTTSSSDDISMNEVDEQNLAPEPFSPPPTIADLCAPSASQQQTLPVSPKPAQQTPQQQQQNQNQQAEPSLKEQYKAEINAMITDPKDLDVTLDDFPYFISKETKQMLMSTAYLFLVKPEYVKFTSDLPSVSRRILLEGPTGTELYQEQLIRALAKHFNALLLILDATYLEAKEKGSSSSPPSTSSASVPLHIRQAQSLAEISGSDDDGDYMDDYRRFSVLDANKRRFKVDDRVKYMGPSSSLSGMSRHMHQSGDGSRSVPHRGPYAGYKGKVMMTFEDNPRRVGVRFDKAIVGGVDLGGLCEENHGFFVDTSELKKENDTTEDRAENVALTALFEILTQSSRPIILYIKDAEKTILNSYERYSHFKKELGRINKMSLPLLIIGNSIASDTRRDKGHGGGLLLSKGANHHTALLDLSFFDHISRIEERAKESSKTTKVLNKLLPNKIAITPPKDPILLTQWKERLDKDVEQLKSETNQVNIKKVLEKNNIECDGLGPQLLKKQVFSTEHVEKVVGWAISHHLMNAETVDVKDDKLCISPKSVEHGIEMLVSGEPENKAVRNLKDVETENEFEKRILSEVIPPHEIAIRFDDIGALSKVKETLKELVMLPLQRPELFRKGNLTKPCKGILLFGPPGTGKTMLAKAVATESGANFINVSMSTIGSKWFGEGEKYARAVFTLASKISPSIIFIDEVDSILGKRDRSGEHEAMRKIKNEFMSMWDGLRTKEGERVLVLAASNRPFDLDDAVLRRLSRRILVDLPDQDNRVKILQVILAKEDLAPNVPLEALASMTEGYSGSDLKNLAIAAAYQPIREFLRNEKLRAEKGEQTEPEEVKLRSITMDDFTKAKEEVGPSVSEDAFSIGELRKWNEMYGEGGSRVKSTLTYFV
jgi:SpoVK/Ycf46/Vps4 family AAA+-type ATPase